MEAFIRDRGIPEHYQCEEVNKTQKEWYAEGTQNYTVGILSLLFGIACQLLYIPCLIVFYQKDLWQLAVYKIMFYITSIDMLNLISNGILLGIFTIEGAVFCNHPYIIYISGSIEMGAWTGCCIGSLFLILTRIVDLISADVQELLFSGRKILFTMVIMISYQMYFIMFSKPVLFNSTATTWLFNPMIYHDGRDAELFADWAIVVNNLGTVSVTIILYVVFFTVFAYKMNKTYNYKMDKKQKQILAQSCIICLNNFVLALVYVSFVFVPPGPLLVAISLKLWQFSSASGVFVFYVMNKTVRRRIFGLFGLQNLVKDSTVNPSVPLSK